MDSHYLELIFKKEPKHIYLITIILLFIVFIISIFLLTYQYYPYYQTTGIISKEGETKYVKILVELDKLVLIKNADLILNHKKYEYDVYTFDQNIYSENNKLYKQLGLIIKDDLEENSEILDISFRLSKTTIFKQIKKGMMKWI